MIIASRMIAITVKAVLCEGRVQYCLLESTSYRSRFAVLAGTVSCCAIVAAVAPRQLAGMKTVGISLVAPTDAERWYSPGKRDYVDNSRRSGIIPPMILTLDAKRRLTLPTSLVSAQPGDNFEAVFDPEEDAVIFRRLSKNTNWLTVLKGCPVKMDDLPPRRREFPKRLKL